MASISEPNPNVLECIQTVNGLRLHVYATLHVNCADINLALNKPANQPSTFTHDTVPFVATRAVDGDQTTVSCTRGHVHPWWSIDLGEAYNVGRVTVTHDSNELQGNYRRTYCIINEQNGNY